MKKLLLPLLALPLAPLAIDAAPRLERIGGDFERPLFVNSRPGDARFLFIVEQAGRILIYDQESGGMLQRPFLDISDEVSRRGNEEGLLGFAFSPNYAQDGRIYVNFSNKDKTNEIARYTVANPKQDLFADRDSKELILSFEQPARNHNGGYLEFGPDEMLYIGTGDGGAGNDPWNNAQNKENLLGKILRIDVSGEKGYTVPKDNPFVGESGRPEILAYGLRNPWRCAWDGDTFYIADVGQNKWEEVNVVSASELNGANFGWRLREGFHATPGDVGGKPPKGAIEPVIEYDHGTADDEGLSINGGFVYRGSVSELEGQYLYSDHVNPRIWSFEYANGKAINQRDLTDTLARPDGEKFSALCSFGQDSDMEVYVVEMSGAVWKIVD